MDDWRAGLPGEEDHSEPAQAGPSPEHEAAAPEAPAPVAAAPEAPAPVAPAPEAPAPEAFEPEVTAPPAAPPGATPLAAPRLPWEAVEAVSGGPAGQEEPAEPAALPEEAWQAESRVAEERAAPAARPSGAGKVMLCAFIILLVALLGAGGLAFKLWSDRIAAQEALQAAVETLNMGFSPAPGDPLAGRLQALRGATERGQFVEVASRLQGLLRGVSPRGAQGGGASGAGGLGGLEGPLGGPAPLPGAAGPGAAGPPAHGGAAGGAQKGGELPPGVEEFFQKNPDLAKAFDQSNLAGLQLKEHGGDVTRLRQLREAIVEAARLGDKNHVVKLLREFEQEFRQQAMKLMAKGGKPGPGGGPRAGRGPQRPPAAMLQMGEKINQAMQQARLQGRDVRPAMEIVNRATQAAQRGNFRLALQLGEKALDAIRHAPKLSATPQWFNNPLVGMFADLLGVEDRDLGAILASLKQGYDEVKTQAGNRLAATVRSSISALEGVSGRRAKFQRRLAEISNGAPVVTAGQVEAALRERAGKSRVKLGDLLAQARGMSPEEFTRSRDKLVDQVLQLVFPTPPGPAQAKPPGPAAPTPPAAAEDAETVKRRIQAKLLSAAEPYEKIKADPKQAALADKLGDLFSRARKALAAGRLPLAEALTDQGLRLMGLPVGRPAAPGPPAAPKPAPASVPAPAPAPAPGLVTGR